MKLSHYLSVFLNIILVIVCVILISQWYQAYEDSERWYRYYREESHNREHLEKFITNGIGADYIKDSPNGRWLVEYEGDEIFIDITTDYRIRLTDKSTNQSMIV